MSALRSSHITIRKPLIRPRPTSCGREIRTGSHVSVSARCTGWRVLAVLRVGATRWRRPSSCSRVRSGSRTMSTSRRCSGVRSARPRHSATTERACAWRSCAHSTGRCQTRNGRTRMRFSRSSRRFARRCGRSGWTWTSSTSGLRRRSSSRRTEVRRRRVRWSP